MRTLVVVFALALLAPLAGAQLASEADRDLAAVEQAELQADGWIIMGITFAAIALGAAGMWWVNHRYHPPGEAARARSRRD